MGKKIAALIMVITIVMSLAACTSDGIKGSGTEEDPWLCGATENDDVRIFVVDNSLWINGDGKMMDFENLLMNVAYCLGQALALLLVAPLVSGIVKKVKALLQNRVGSSIFQEYVDIYKWWRKPVMLTPYTGIIFKLAPCVYFLTTFIAAAMLPNLFGAQMQICIS